MTRLSILLAIAFALACANQPDSATSGLDSGRGYTLVNLHPDNERSRLYAVNLQQPGRVTRQPSLDRLGR